MATTDEQMTPEQMWNQELENQGIETEAKLVVPTPEAPVVAAEAQAQAATPAPEVASTQTPAPAVEDPYAGLSPAVKAELQAARELATRLRNVEGRVGSLISENKVLKDQVSQATAQAVAAKAAVPTAAQIAAAQKQPEKWNQLTKEFPEWGDAIEERLQGLQPSAPVDLDALRTQLKGEIQNEMATSLAEQRKATEERIVSVVHPGWLDLIKTPVFLNWMKAQSQEVRALGDSDVADDAIDLLSRFKREAPEPVDAAALKAQRQARLQAAASIVKGGGAEVPVRSVDDMTQDEYWDYLAKNPKLLEEPSRQRRH